MRFVFNRPCKGCGTTLPASHAHACSHCGGPLTTHLKILANGAHRYTYRCSCCAAASGALPKRLWPTTPDSVESTLGTNPECSVFGCHIRATEHHHWAPYHLFGNDANYWPMSYLCKEHHAEWHKKVTPQMHQTSSSTPLRTPPNGLPPGAFTH